MLDDIINQYAIDEVISWGQEYKHSYVVLDEERAKINFSERTIKYNPVFSEDGLSFCHEMVHHYFHEMVGQPEPTEQIIEMMAQRLYEKNPLAFDNYVAHELGNDYNNQLEFSFEWDDE